LTLAERLSDQIAAVQDTLNALSYAQTNLAAEAVPRTSSPRAVSEAKQGDEEMVGNHIIVRENLKLIDAVVEQTAGRLGSLERRVLYGRSVHIVLEKIAVSEDGAGFEEIANELRYHGGIDAEKVLSVTKQLHFTKEQDGLFQLTDTARRLRS
jgi:hypothetical protein